MTRSVKYARDGLVAFGVVLGMIIVCLLPRSLVWRIGRMSGRLGYYLASSARRVARANLTLAFGNSLSASEQKRIARESIQNLVATLVMLFWSVRLNRKNFRKYVEIDPDNHSVLKSALAQGRGVIYATLHYGDWELLALVMAFLGPKLTLAAQQTANPGLDLLLRFCRSRSGNCVVSEQRSLKRLLRAAYDNGCPALVNDLNANRNRGIWTCFFGLPVYNHPTVGALAIKTGAPIIYGLAHPLGNGRARLEWFEIGYSLSGDRDLDLRNINQACMDLAEQVIRKHPEYWHWGYKRWKRRPTQEIGRYPYYSKFFESKPAVRQASPA